MSDILVKNSSSCKEDSVYAINCACSEFYIGQTNILVTERVAQHQQCVRANDSSNALNVHYGICNQGINWNQPITLINLNDYFSRNMLEAAIIKLTWQNNVNITLGTYTIDNFLLKFIVDQYKLNDLLKSKGLDRR
ncbi:unnamed protein product [Rotaria magnacalcarata]|nr:unnamed protein product [Rotaria magnacalcarata]